MSRMTKTAVSLVGAALLAGCAGGAQRMIGQLESTPATGDAFTQQLAQEYLALAEKEYDLLDYQDSMHFAEKGLRAAGGEAVGPDEVSSRTLQSEYGAEATSIRQQVVDYVNVSRTADPASAATVQALFDCVLEEYEEYWQVEAQPYWLSGCRDALMAALEEAASMPATIGLSADVLFDFDQSDIKAEFTGVLNEIASMIAAAGEQVTIEGHTDSVGSEAYNMALGQRRADSVADYLASQGVSAMDMTTVSYGETRPIAPNDTPEGRALNRRVEIKR